MPATAKTVAVAMSGGVDSAAAAALLVERGEFEVVGVSMHLPSPAGQADRSSTPCCSPTTIGDARRVADLLGIRFYALDQREAFRRAVIADFVESYAGGRTPNPCARCNERVKFGTLLHRVRTFGADMIATGHYVRKARGERGGWTLRTAPSDDDQSYFLYGLSQEQLAAALFPVGGMEKSKVRAVARRHDLPVHDKPGSQDLCFLGETPYTELLREQHPDMLRPGPIVHVTGAVLGEHSGLPAYTVGQRRGLGIAHPEPLYVVEVRPEDNTVVVGERRHLRRETITVGKLNWIMPDGPPSAPLRASVKIRYNHPGAPAAILPDGNGGGRVVFDEAQEAPCPGQSAVFYDDGVVLGGGTIEEEQSRP